MNNKKDIQIIEDARKLCIHTLKVTNNLNNFPKKYRFTLVDKLVKKSMEIFDEITEANCFCGEDRLYHQSKAIAYCKEMKFYLEMVYDVIKPKCSIVYWTDLIDSVESQAKKWRSVTNKQFNK